MKPVRQRYNDDCVRACIASILDLDYDDVPHFFDGSVSGEQVSPESASAMAEFFYDRGLYPIQIPMGAESLSELTEAVAEHHPDLHFIVMGKSAFGVHHAVVCGSGELVHDPGRSNSGLTGPMDDGLWHVMFIGIAV